MGHGRIVLNKDGVPLLSVDLPPGLIAADLSDLDPVPAPLSFATRFSAILAVNGPASITLSAAPARGPRSLTHVVRQCAAERGSSNPRLSFENFGGENCRHPGLLAEIAPGCEFGLFEDGGTVFVMEAVGDPTIWVEYEPFLQRAMLSVELLKPSGPTLPLSPGGKAPEIEAGVPDPDAVAAAARESELDTKSAVARQLIEAGRFDEAERLLVEYGAGPDVHARMGRLYENELRRAESADNSIREALYRRALDWKMRSYPDPHTQIEADNYRRYMAEDKSVLVKLLGYEPE